VSAPADQTRATDALPPAFRLACACSRWPPSPARDEAVRQAALGVDWERFVRVLARQRLGGLSERGVAAAAGDAAARGSRRS